jgi:hypothetical protein
MHRGAIKRSGQWCANRGEPLPAVEDANDFMAASRCAVYNGANRRVEAGAVAAAS